MKKLFAGIAATALAAAMCVSFAACGESGADKAKSIKGETVTEEQWDAAFAAFEKDEAKFTIEAISSATSTYTLDLTVLGEGKKSGTLSQKATYTYINNGAKQSAKGTMEVSAKGDFSYAELVEYLEMGEYASQEGKSKDEVYSEKAAIGYTVYTKDKDGKWQKNASAGGAVPLYYFDEAGNFGDYKYDETLKGYVEKDYKADDENYQVYKFDKDGNLVAFYSHTMMEAGTMLGETSEVGYTISYTAKDITLPTVA